MFGLVSHALCDYQFIIINNNREASTNIFFPTLNSLSVSSFLLGIKHCVSLWGCVFQGESISIYIYYIVQVKREKTRLWTRHQESWQLSYTYRYSGESESGVHGRASSQGQRRRRRCFRPSVERYHTTLINYNSLLNSSLSLFLLSDPFN